MPMREGKHIMSHEGRRLFLPALLAGCAVLAAIGDASAQSCAAMRKINIGVSVAPPNVVHTSPYVAKELGFFAKRCIEPNIIQFEGGQSATSAAAATQGSAIVSVSDVAIGRGLKVQQFWGLAPRMPQAYMVSPDVKTAADLKGKRLSATGGGVGGFNWRMGREVLKTVGLTVDDAQFVASATAGRLPGLVAGLVDGVALHPEDVYLAKKQKPALNVLLQLAELMPNYMFNAYGASLDWIARGAVGVEHVIGHQLGELKEDVERRLLLLGEIDVLGMERHAVDLAGDEARQAAGGGGGDELRVVDREARS